MTTGTRSNSKAASLRHWARTQLNLPEGAGKDAAVQTLRARLQDEDFLPPWEWQTALRVLTGQQLPPESASQIWWEGVFDPKEAYKKLLGIDDLPDQNKDGQEDPDP